MKKWISKKYGILLAGVFLCIISCEKDTTDEFYISAHELIITVDVWDSPDEYIKFKINREGYIIGELRMTSQKKITETKEFIYDWNKPYLARIIRRNGNGNIIENIQYQHTYNETGKPVRCIVEGIRIYNDMTWNFSYDSTGRLIRKEWDQSGPESTYYGNTQYYYNNHNLSYAIDSITDPIKNGFIRIDYSYIENGLLGKIHKHNQYSSSDSTLYDYDTNNRLVMASSFSGLTLLKKDSIVYDSYNRYVYFNGGPLLTDFNYSEFYELKPFYYHPCLYEYYFLNIPPFSHFYSPRHVSELYVLLSYIKW